MSSTVGSASRPIASSRSSSGAGAREVLDDGEAEARPAHLSRARSVHAVEAPEDARQVLRRYAFACVRDADEVALALLVPDRDGVRAAAELDLVIYEFE
jgi:hypothetical protein